MSGKASSPVSDRASRVVNAAILVTLAILLLNPSGLVGRWVTATYESWREQHRIKQVWDELAGVPSVLGSRPTDNRSVIAEFVDYDCPACQAVAQRVRQVTLTQGLSVAILHVPSEKGGSAAAEAALAAICAERHDLFPKAHEALFLNRAWLSSRDWSAFAVSLGIGDPELFVRCMGEDATRDRLDRDRTLAEYLRIPGTPTFVSFEGLHLGTQGLFSALAAAQGITAEAEVPLQLPGESAFDSSEFPGLSELLRITAGFFLSDGTLALVDRTEIHVVNRLSGEARVLGREGAGPQEFRHIEGAIRTPEGIAVWDILQGRLTFISRNGEFLGSQSYGAAPFQGFGASPVGVRPDGRVVFRDKVDRVRLGDYVGRTWDRVRYVSLGPDEGLHVMTEAKGQEVHYRPDASGSVIFGHQTLEASTADHLVIAETDREAIAVFDWDGVEIASIPMPAAIGRASTAQVRMAREFRAAELQRRGERWLERVASGAVPGWDPVDHLWSPEPEVDWPANDVVPPIDMVLADADARLWVRDYLLPDQDSVTWRVWDIEDARLLFTARTAVEATLLDARGDMVLLRELDAFDVPRAVVRDLLDTSSP